MEENVPSRLDAKARTTEEAGKNATRPHMMPPGREALRRQCPHETTPCLEIRQR